MPVLGSPCRFATFKVLGQSALAHEPTAFARAKEARGSARISTALKSVMDFKFEAIIQCIVVVAALALVRRLP